LPLPTEYSLVADPVALERAGLFVGEGRIVVERLLTDARFRVHSIAVTAPAAEALGAVLARAASAPPLHVCAAAELQAVTGFHFHRGCIALAERPRTLPIPGLTSATRVLALEGVGNPDNVGGLFRAAFALGVDALLLDPASGDPFYRKAIRTSMAATLRLPFARVAEWPDGLDEVRRAGFEIAALTPAPDAIGLDDYARAPHPRLLLAVGSEGAGLGASMMRYADARVRIPIDARADSLNVVVAAGIALSAL
jgi:tRNA G18 (ribose-2'-O)-methylase SpoU